jgi:hypothetical protein
VSQLHGDVAAAFLYTIANRFSTDIAVSLCESAQRVGLINRDDLPNFKKLI